MFSKSKLPSKIITKTLIRNYAIPTSTQTKISASSPIINSPFIIFDRNVKKLQRDRAASDKIKSRLTDYVKDEVAANMVDRLLVSSFPFQAHLNTELFVCCFSFSREMT